MNTKAKKQPEVVQNKARPYKGSRYKGSQSGEEQHHHDKKLWKAAITRLQARSWESSEQLEDGLIEIVAEELHIPQERQAEVREFLEFVLEVDEELAEHLDELKRRLVAHS